MLVVFFSMAVAVSIFILGYFLGADKFPKFGSKYAKEEKPTIYNSEAIFDWLDDIPSEDGIEVTIKESPLPDDMGSRSYFIQMTGVHDDRTCHDERHVCLDNVGNEHTYIYGALESIYSKMIRLP